MLNPYGSIKLTEDEFDKYKERGWIKDGPMVLARKEGAHFSEDRRCLVPVSVHASEEDILRTLSLLQTNFLEHCESLSCHRKKDLTSYKIREAKNNVLYVVNSIKNALISHSEKLGGIHASVDGDSVSLFAVKNKSEVENALNLCVKFFNFHLLSVAHPIKSE